MSMRLEFKATEGGFADQGDPTFCLVCGVSGLDEVGIGHYLTFQRTFEGADPADDDGVHCEFDDQINGAYDCVARCRATRNLLEVTLTWPIDPEKRYLGVAVDLSELDLPSVEELRAGPAAHLPGCSRGPRNGLIRGRGPRPRRSWHHGSVTSGAIALVRVPDKR